MYTLRCVRPLGSQICIITLVVCTAIEMPLSAQLTLRIYLGAEDGRASLHTLQCACLISHQRYTNKVPGADCPPVSIRKAVPFLTSSHHPGSSILGSSHFLVRGFLSFRARMRGRAFEKKVGIPVSTQRAFVVRTELFLRCDPNFFIA